MTVKGIKEIAEALKENRTLAVLDLRNNQIGEEGAKAILDALKVNDVLIDINLLGNEEISDNLLKQIEECLARNRKRAERLNEKKQQFCENITHLVTGGPFAEDIIKTDIKAYSFKDMFFKFKLSEDSQEIVEAADSHEVDR